jgi:hypothetical protein
VADIIFDYFSFYKLFVYVQIVLCEGRLSFLSFLRLSKLNSIRYFYEISETKCPRGSCPNFMHKYTQSLKLK